MSLNLQAAGPAALIRLSDGTPPRIMHFPWLRAKDPRACRALVVDDDPNIPPLVKHALSRYDIECSAVADGIAALDAVRKDQPSIVILDLQMPDTSGFDVLRILRADRRFFRLPVMVLTASHEDLALARSFGYGADDYVTKPFNPVHLAMRVYSLLRPRQHG